MRYSILLISSLGLLSACTKSPPMSVEEKMLFTAFTSYVGALTYDEICNGTDPKSRYDFKRLRM